MNDQCIKQITKTISNWSAIEVRTVPGLMYQARCGNDEKDPSIEYQFNWFIDCTETYIHNHRHSFDTLCLDGEYIERSWQIDADNTNAVTYQFHRNSGGILANPKVIPGVLRQVKSRHHFAGNQMHVSTEQFHSVSPIVGSDCRVLTFLRRRKHSSTSDVFVLSSSSAIDAPNDENRPATGEERQEIYNKLQDILISKFLNQIPLVAENSPSI